MALRVRNSLPCLEEGHNRTEATELGLLMETGHVNPPLHLRNISVNGSWQSRERGTGRETHKVTWEKIVLLNYCVYTEAALPVLDFSQNVAISVS